MGWDWFGKPEKNVVRFCDRWSVEWRVADCQNALPFFGEKNPLPFLSPHLSKGSPKTTNCIAASGKKIASLRVPWEKVNLPTPRAITSNPTEALHSNQWPRRRRGAHWRQWNTKSREDGWLNPPPYLKKMGIPQNDGMTFLSLGVKMFKKKGVKDPSKKSCSFKTTTIFSLQTQKNTYLKQKWSNSNENFTQ